MVKSLLLLPLLAAASSAAPARCGGCKDGRHLFERPDPSAVDRDILPDVFPENYLRPHGVDRRSRAKVPAGMINYRYGNLWAGRPDKRMVPGFYNVIDAKDGSNDRRDDTNHPAVSMSRSIGEVEGSLQERTSTLQSIDEREDESTAPPSLTIILTGNSDPDSNMALGIGLQDAVKNLVKEYADDEEANGMVQMTSYAKFYVSKNWGPNISEKSSWTESYLVQCSAGPHRICEAKLDPDSVKVKKLSEAPKGELVEISDDAPETITIETPSLTITGPKGALGENRMLFADHLQKQIVEVAAKAPKDAGIDAEFPYWHAFENISYDGVHFFNIFWIDLWKVTCSAGPDRACEASLVPGVVKVEEQQVEEMVAESETTDGKAGGA